MNSEQSPSNQSPISGETSSANSTATDGASAAADQTEHAEQAATETSEIKSTSLEQQPQSEASSDSSGEPAGDDTIEIPTIEIPTIEIPTVEIPTVTEKSPPAESAEITDNEASAKESDSDAGKANGGEANGDAETNPPSPQESRPRVRLNPTVDPRQAVAVPSPSLAGPVAPDPGDSDEVAAAAAVQAAAPPPPPAEPVELPPANEQLDSDIEAEIAAAMSIDETSATSAIVGSGETAPNSAQATTEEELEPGTKLKGRVQSIQRENILLDVGFRASAIVQLRQFEGRKEPQLGQELEVLVDRFDAADGVLLASLPRMARSVGNWDEVSVNQVVQCLVKKSNKGGLEVTVSNLRGFLPASQVDLGYVADLSEYVGQKLTVKIIEVKPEKRNLVVSRRAYLQDEREEIGQELWKHLEKGQTHNGKVKTIKDYGAFVDIGGVDGLLHVAEMSWTRVNHPRDILSPGQEIDVQIIGIDPEKKRISLSMRRLKKNPWDDVVERFPVESIVSGKVTNIADFGAFVEIEEGVEGLVHISEIDHRRINKVTDVLKQGEEVEAKVVSIDPAKKRIGLSMKALKHKPEAPAKPKDEDLAPGGSETFERKRKGPLKGGTGGSSGPLFG